MQENLLAKQQQSTSINNQNNQQLQSSSTLQRVGSIGGQRVNSIGGQDDFKHTMTQSILCEFFGTIFFGYSVVTATSTFHVGIGLFINLVFTHTISFALLNPAVTTAIMLLPSPTLKYSIKKGLLYQLAQYCGVFVGGCLAYLITGSTFWFPNNGNPQVTSFSSFPNGQTGTWLLRIFFGEMFGTAVFCMVNIVGWNRRVFNVPFYALSFIAAGLVLCATWNPYSGGSINPAMSFSLNLVQQIAYGTNSMEYIWVYLLAEYIGAAFGVGFYQLVWRVLLNYQTHESYRNVD